MSVINFSLLKNCALSIILVKLLEYYHLCRYKEKKNAFRKGENLKGPVTLRPFPYQVCAEGALLEQISCGRLNPLQIVGLYNIYRFERHMSMHSTKKRTFNFLLSAFLINGRRLMLIS